MPHHPLHAVPKNTPLSRRRDPLSVIMIDPDHFSCFNNTYGHEAGDLGLAEFGRLLSRPCRREEFTLVLPETPLAVACQLQIEYRRQALDPFSLSCGVTSFPEHGQDPETLLRFADAALYQAKHAGRDHVVCAELPAHAA